MHSVPIWTRRPLLWAITLTVLAGLGHALPDVRFFADPRAYLSWHSGLEFISIAVSAMVFSLAWATRRQANNGQALVLGVGLLAVGLIDFAHTLSYPGMPSWGTPSSMHKAIFFWLAGRYVAAGVLLALVLQAKPLHWPWPSRKLLLLAGVGLAMAVWWVGLTHLDWLPPTYGVGSGLTAFKIGAEYLVVALYALAALLLARRSWHTGNEKLAWLAVSAWVLGLTELFFALYVDSADLFNFIGHFYKLLAYLMLYRAVFIAGVREPYEQLDEERMKLRAIQDRLSITLNAIGDGVIVTNLQGRITDINPAAQAMLARDSAQVFGHPLADVFHCIDKQTLEPVTVAIQDVLSGGKTFVEGDGLVLVGRGGQEHQISMKASAIQTPAGATSGLVLVVRDVSVAHAAREQQRRAAELLRQVGEIAKVGGWQLDVPTMEITWAEELRHLYGLDPMAEAILGRALDFVTPEDRSRAGAALRAAIEQGRPWSFDMRSTDASGAYLWLHSQGTATMRDGRVLRLTSAIQDITERKQMEQQMLDSEQRYRELFQASPLPMWVVDAETLRFRLVNKAAVRHYGYSEREFLSMSITDIRPGGEVPRPLTAITEPPDQVFSDAVPSRHIKKDGSPIEVELNYRLVQFSGRPSRLVLAHDVTERNKARHTLQEQRLRMMAVVESAMDGVILVDQHERIVIFNAAAERIFGCSAAEVTGRTLERFIPVHHRAAHHENMRMFGKTGQTTRTMGPLGTTSALTATALRANGEAFPIEASISHSTVSDELIYIVILRDIGDRVRAANALMNQRIELSALTQRLMDSEEETNRALAQALHDQLGQTLTALRLTFDAYQGAGSNAAADGVEHWRERLSDLIDRSMLQVRRVLVDLRPALLEEMGLAAAINNELKNIAFVNKNVTILFDPDAEVLQHRWPEKLEYVVFMIAREAVTNAVQHANATRIEVRLTHGAPDLQLMVSDNGVGFDADRTHVRVGHLGLVGMRERAVAIGGHLLMVSSPGAGSTITFDWSPE